MIQNLVNHIALVVDASSSIESAGLTDTVINVVDGQIKTFAKQSVDMNQETRLSIYLFSDNFSINCLLYDMDVMRVPSIKGHYKPYGNTALIDANLRAINDLRKTATLYGDHAFLVYCVTDGFENNSRGSGAYLVEEIKKLEENYTFAAFVPNQNGIKELLRFGFPKDNIQTWEASKDGVKEMGDIMTVSTQSFMTARSAGTRSMKKLFTVDTTNLNSKAVKKHLIELNPKEYQVLSVHQKKAIKEFVEGWTKKPYRIGSAYYMLTKPETIQATKQICVEDKKNGKVYTGDSARDFLKLPDYEVKVDPVKHTSFNIFVQSKSLNRNLVPGTTLIVLN